MQNGTFYQKLLDLAEACILPGITADNEESCIRRAGAQAIALSQAIAALRIQSR